MAGLASNPKGILRVRSPTRGWMQLNQQTHLSFPNYSTTCGHYAGLFLPTALAELDATAGCRAAVS